MVQLFLVRHADAGSRSDWTGDDCIRPLSPVGEQQATGVRTAFAAEPVTRIFSSPAVRCIQTVQPLADELGITIEVADVLREGSWVTEVIGFAESLDETVVFSSHGDVIPEMLRGLVSRGMTLLDDWRWEKGSTWVISRDGDKFTAARYLPPVLTDV